MRMHHGRNVETNTLTVKRVRQAKSRVPRFRKIIVPVDFSPSSQNALEHAVRCAEEFGADLMLLYVLEALPCASLSGITDAMAFWESDFESAAKKLRTVADEAGNGSTVDIRWKIRAGVPAHEIVEFAKENDADLIVIATHGHTGWKHFCIGSTAERVVRAAPCPVLVVRQKEHELSGAHL